ncbi:MAG: C_GCAxxG_C_C family protein [Firmicutes bacterium]|nr:C_GCAxxG_C_C family protein [Bacillota bacterium]
MDKKETAVKYKHSGFNCAQAVLAAFSDEMKIGEQDAKRLGAAFGSGMGGMEGTCGALCGAEIVLGMVKYTGAPIMKQARELHAGFKAKCGASICKDLKQIINGKPLCSCDDCVRNAAALTEEIIKNTI